MQAARVVLDHDDIRRTLVRIGHEIVEKNPDGELALVGIHRRGAVLGQRLHALTSELLDGPVPLGFADISFYRDDLAIRPGAPVVHATQLDFSVDGRTVVIVDDVLYTGRTVRAAIDEIFDYGRPARVQLAVLVDRGHREFPSVPTTWARPSHLPGGAGERARRGDRRPRRGDDWSVLRAAKGRGMRHLSPSTTWIARGLSGSSIGPSRSPRSPDGRSRRSRPCADARW